MSTWVPGALALVGALAGVLLTNWLTRRTKRADERQKRLEDALRSVLLAIAAKNFATSAGITGKPASVLASDVDELSRRLWLENVERMFKTLREARETVALLVADGVPVGDYWRGDEEMQEHLEDLHALLRRSLLELAT